MIKKRIIKTIISFLVAILLFSSLFLSAFTVSATEKSDKTETTVQSTETTGDETEDSNDAQELEDFKSEIESVSSEENETETAASDESDEPVDYNDIDSNTGTDVLEDMEITDSMYEELISNYYKKDENAEYVTVPYVENKGTVFEPEFPYSDDYFRTSSDTYDHYLMQATLGLITAAFRPVEGDKTCLQQGETYFENIGFTNVSKEGYDSDPTEDSLSTLIASKKIDDFTVIALSACGLRYGKEWASNLKVGDETRHVGFNEAAKIFEERLTEYIEENNITGKIKLWIGGYSRAAAVGNLVAADMIEEGTYEDVYAYLLATPNTTKEPLPYAGIYNIVGEYDPVQLIPLSSWGYGKYGKVYYTPSQEMNSDWSFKSMLAGTYSIETFNKSFRNNPELDNELTMVLQCLAELIPTSTEYEQKLQPLLIKAITDKSVSNLQDVLVGALSELDDLSDDQKQIRDTLVNYIEVIMTDYLKGNTREIEDGNWDTSVSLANNLFHEHMPSTYYSWIFSYNKKQVYESKTKTRKVIFSGIDLSFSVSDEDKTLEEIDKNGKVTYLKDENTKLTEFSIVYAMRNGNQTIFLIPADKDYTLTVTTENDQTVTYATSTYNVAELTNSDIYYANLDFNAGTYTVSFDTSDFPGTITGPEGEFLSDQLVAIGYTPEMIMQLENENVYHLTISGLLTLAKVLIGFFIVLFLFCLVTFIIHAIRRKTVHKVYSMWWVLVPLVLLSLVCAALTIFFTNSFTALAILKTISSALTVAVLFVIALRGTFRNRIEMNKVVTMFVFIIGAVGVVLYATKVIEPIGDNGITKYLIGYIIILVLAASTFFNKSKWRRAYELKETGIYEMHDVGKVVKIKIKKEKKLQKIADKDSKKAKELEDEIKELEDRLDKELEDVEEVEKKESEFEKKYGESVDEALKKEKDDE